VQHLHLSPHIAAVFFQWKYHIWVLTLVGDLMKVLLISSASVRLFLFFHCLWFFFFCLRHLSLTAIPQRSLMHITARVRLVDFTLVYRWLTRNESLTLPETIFPLQKLQPLNTLVCDADKLLQLQLNRRNSYTKRSKSNVHVLVTCLLRGQLE
jgi:hypothetical protein